MTVHACTRAQLDRIAWFAGLGYRTVTTGTAVTPATVRQGVGTGPTLVTLTRPGAPAFTVTVDPTGVYSRAVEPAS